MLHALGITESIEMLVFLMLSFAFFVGIMLVVSQEAFKHFNDALSKEYGIQKRIVPGLEDTNIRFIDWVILRYRLIAGLLISISSFILLMLYKI